MTRPQQNNYRKLIPLDGIWNCAVDNEDIGVREQWFKGLPKDSIRPIAVPASWNEQYRDLFFYFGKLWYAHTVHVDDSCAGHKLLLHIGSACNTTGIWINGQDLGRHSTAHLPVSVDVSPHIYPGSNNLIVLCVDGSLDPWGLPPAVLQSGEAREGFFNSNPPVTYDFYPYAGIHRSVSLLALPPTHIEKVRVNARPADDTAEIEVAVTLSSAFSGSLRFKIEDEATADTLCQLSGKITKTKIRMRKPELWSPSHPTLYAMEVLLENESGEVVDSYRIRFGVRSVRVEAGQLKINGERVFLKGFGKHEDFFVSGRAFNPAVMIKDFDLLRWIGANSFRTSHYPYAEEVLDLADELGFLVIDESPMVSLNERLYTPEKSSEANQLLRRMIERDYNHPSVIMWSVANEPNIDSTKGVDFFHSMIDTVRREDSSRPVTYVAHREPEQNLPLDAVDVVCLNKYYGWYELPGELDRGTESLAACLERYYRKFNKPILMTEFGADAVEGSHSEPSVMFSEEYQSEIIQRQYELLADTSYVIGAHVWAFSDFRTAMSISRVITNRKGVFTRDRQPKLSAHTLRRLWNE